MREKKGSVRFAQATWSKNKFVWDKNSVLEVDVLAEILLQSKNQLQSKKNQSCFGLTSPRCVLVPSQVMIYILLI